MDPAVSELAPFINLALPWAHRLILALARAGGLWLALPSFIGQGVPGIVRGSALVAIAGLLALIGAPLHAHPVRFGLELLSPILVEFIFGLSLGFLATVTINAARIAGQMIGIEMGLSFAAIADPLSQGQGTVLSSIVGTLAAQLFIAMGLDRELVRALALSVARRPLGTTSFDLQIATDILMLGKDMFQIALRIAIPVVGTLFTLKLSMAYLARVAPRLQIFSLTFVLTLLVGQWVFVTALPSIGLMIADELRATMKLIWSLAAQSSHGD